MKTLMEEQVLEEDEAGSTGGDGSSNDEDRAGPDEQLQI
jgi:hypothetical protein